MNEFLWKIISIALLFGLLGVGGKLWLTDRDLNKTEQKLATEQTKVASLTTAINTQNAAIDKLNTERERAEIRADAAWQATAKLGAKVDSVLSKVKDAQAKTCADAMPVVDQILEGLK